MKGKYTNNKKRLEEIASQQFGYFTAFQAIKAGYNALHHIYHVKKGNWLYIEKGF